MTPFLVFFGLACFIYAARQVFAAETEARNYTYVDRHPHADWERD